MNRSRPTITEVARLAGVSPATVSRVINGTARVSKEKAKVVLEAMEALGYSPNPQAQSLARGRSFSVGIILPDFSSPFFGPILEVITAEFEPTPFRFIPVPGHFSPIQEMEALEFLKAHRVEALVLLGTSLTPAVLSETGIPILSFAQPVEGARSWSLLLNNRQAAYHATRYLLEKGHRNIVHISSNRGAMDIRERLVGYRKAMQEAGLEARVVYGNLQEDGGYRAAAEILTRYPDTTAIFTANDQTAFGVRFYLYEQGLDVPEDISLLGFDDVTLAAYQIPPLTTVRQPAKEIGHALAEALKAILSGQEPQLPVIPLRLIERGSVKEVRDQKEGSLKGRQFRQ